jgi:uracil phosphoribosyltransferase
MKRWSNVYNLEEEPSVANQFTTELRDKEIQINRLRFRNNLKRLGECMAFEISKSLNYFQTEVQTPLGLKKVWSIQDEIVLATVFRAGLPMYQGFLNFFDNADSAFVGAYRNEGSDNISIQTDYVVSPNLNNKVLIMIDPMLATGSSLADALDSLIGQSGTPERIIIASAVSAPEGIDFLLKKYTEISVYTEAVDEGLI